MTSIRSISEILLKDEELGDPQRNRFVGLIHQESVRLTRLLDEILDLSALEHGERLWDNLPIDAEAVLERAVGVCEPLARQRSIRIERTGDGQTAWILGDADRLCQVFINIIANAISHNSSPAPQVLVRSMQSDDHFIVEVADNGPGIAEEFRSTIFEKFVRAGVATNSGLLGLGLGLNISHTIITKLGGRIDVVEGPLPGACFRISLPLCPAPAV